MHVEHRTWTVEQLSRNKYRHVAHISPVSYLNHGSWCPITSTIASLRAEVVGCEELIHFRIRPILEDGIQLLHFEYGDSFVDITPMGVNTRVGIINGNSILFKDAWDGADLEYINGGHLLSEKIHLKERHPSVFRFRMDAQAGFDPKTLKFGTDFLMRQPVLEADSGLYVPTYIFLTMKVESVLGHYELVVTLPPGDYAGCVIDPNIVIQPDAAAGYDNWIRSGSPTDKNGAVTQMGCGDFGGPACRERFILKFSDLSGIPGGSTIDDVTVSLFNHYAEDTASIGPWDVQMRRLLRNWVELNSDWDDYDDPNAWSTGGAGTDNFDRYGGDAALESCDEPATGAFVNWIEGTGQSPPDMELVACVQNWLDGAWDNYGWVFFATSAEAQSNQQAGSLFRTSDHTTAAERPKMSVDYTPAVVEQDRQVDQVIFIMEAGLAPASRVDQIVMVLEGIDATRRVSFEDVLAEFEQHWRLISLLDIQVEYEQKRRMVSQLDVLVEYIGPAAEDMTQIRGWDQVKPWSIMPDRLHESVAGRGIDSGGGAALVLKPHRLKQVAQPTPNSGELWIWYDEGSGQIKLVYNDPDAGVKTATFS